MAELILPPDLMFEILLRLPVKTIVRLRCVCKRWRDLIESRDFVKLRSNDPPSLLILHHLPNSKAYDVVDLSSVRSGASSTLDFKQFPVPGEGEFPYYVGTCNGLVCIADAAGVLLWNPATGKQFRFGLPPQEVWHWGFGYDEDSDDYKVVALEWAEPPAVECGRYLVWIYSLRSRSWNCIKDFPYPHIGLENCVVFVNGALHYAVQLQQPESYACSIGALHLGELEYDLIPEPEYNPGMRTLAHLGALDGRLCVMYRDGYNVGGVNEFDLWTMKEYGVKESWTRLVSCRAGYPCGLIPLTYLEDEEVLLFNAEKKGCEFENRSLLRMYDYNEIVGYEFRTRSFGRTYEIKSRISYGKMDGGYWSCRLYVYAPSLVFPEIDI